MGPQRGRNMPQQHYQSNNVSPWQAPNNNPMNQGLLGQLSTPQQLALALTSLLQPQQQQQQQNPPSLLSLNTAPYGRDGYDNQNRFGNRGRADFKRLDSFKVTMTVFIFWSGEHLSFSSCSPAGIIPSVKSNKIQSSREVLSASSSFPIISGAIR